MTPLDIAKALKEKRAKATQGEWTSHDNHGVRYVSNGKDGPFAKFDNRICEAAFNLHHPPVVENMDFITFAANHSETLADAFIELVEQNKDLNKALDALWASLRHFTADEFDSKPDQFHDLIEIAHKSCEGRRKARIEEVLK